jgi:hypothetical protein
MLFSVQFDGSADNEGSGINLSTSTIATNSVTPVDHQSNTLIVDNSASTEPSQETTEQFITIQPLEPNETTTQQSLSTNSIEPIESGVESTTIPRAIESTTSAINPIETTSAINPIETTTHQILTSLLTTQRPTTTHRNVPSTLTSTISSGQQAQTSNVPCRDIAINCQFQIQYCRSAVAAMQTYCAFSCQFCDKLGK